MSRYIVIILVVVALGFSCLPAVAQPKPYTIIVHPDNPTDEISKKKLSAILLKEVSRWGGSSLSAEPVDLDSKSSVRNDFSRDIHGRSVSSIKNYWQRQIFSGGRVPPPEVTGDAEVIDYVKTHPGAVGYVSSSAKLDGVKVLILAAK